MTGLLFQRLALVVYFFSTAGYLVFLFRQNKKAAIAANMLIALGFVLQTIYLAVSAVNLGQLPVMNMAEALGFFGWALIGVYLILYRKFKLMVLGAFVSPLALLLVLLSALFSPEHQAVTPILQSLWMTFHLGTVFAGYGFFGLAFVAGVMYLLQENQIKARRTGHIYHRLPSLNVLDNLNYYCLALGFPMMTIGIITGAVYAQTALGAYWRWDPKEVWSLVLWLVYAALLHQRLTVGWRGRRAAIMAIVGFLLLGFTFVGVSLFLPGYHSFESLQRLRVQ
ncbi:MAG: c-type cytochrome biogenesis protein CcsB [Thermodesulfobacteriota bacterium]|nr:c-type cytochrome biogenesis protein CcsB [Thermodesulfobacteriota bacterium]